MYLDAPEILIYVAAGAFLLGWIVAKIAAYFGNKFKARTRDPRDARIRSLDAELRVAQGSTEKANSKLEQEAKALKAEKEQLAERDQTIENLTDTVTKLKADLKESVIKTRELREELQERAAENIKSEVRLRDIETELSVARASTDLISTGVLDYTEEEDEQTSSAVK
jgi:predicted  nucleic acid-binding Zn-ribbon protein